MIRYFVLPSSYLMLRSLLACIKHNDFNLQNYKTIRSPLNFVSMYVVYVCVRVCLYVYNDGWLDACTCMYICTE